MTWGSSLGRPAARRRSVSAPSFAAAAAAADASSAAFSRLAAGGRSARGGRSRAAGRLGVAARQVVEALESRVFLHAGEDHLLVSTLGPYNGQQKVATGVNVTVTFAEAINAATLTGGTFELRDGNNNLVPAALSYNATTRTATLDPTASLATANTYYYAKVKGGTAGVLAADGATLDGDLAWSFTTGTPAFTESTVFSGLVEPTAVQFLPDGRVFVAEKSGLIKVFASLTATTSTVFADLRTQTHNFWDRGLLGLALDPQFTTGRPYVYALYTYDGDVGGAAPKYGTAGGVSDAGPDATGTGAKVSGRLIRLTASGNVMLAGSEKVLINDWQQQFPSHSIGTIAFGPDGALYASAGDGASFNYADYGQTGNPFADPTSEGGAVRAQDLQTPNDATTLDGSVIRINPDTGDALADNPLYATGKDANAKRIVAEGFRNPFRFTFRPGTNEIWAGDVGWNTWEEINRLPVSTTVVLNYGWPAYEGPNRQSGYDALNLPVLENLYAQGTGAVVTPYYAYQHGEQVVAGSAEPTGGSSVSGVAFYTGDSYPSAYKDALFFSDYSRKTIYVMYAGADGLPNVASRQLFKIGKTASQLAAGPNGDLYYVDLSSGTLNRFQFFTANRPPTALADADRTNGPAPLTVNFSGSRSTDPDVGDTLTYAWDLDGNGLYNDSTVVNPSRTYTAAGTYTVGLKVTDSKGAFNVTTITVTAGNSAPTAAITAPATTLKWKVGDTIAFAGTGTDPQQGNLPGANLHWQLILRHESLIDPNSYHEHIIQEYDGASGSFVAPDHQYPSRLELRLTATDAGGLTNTVSRVLDAQTTTLTFTSNAVGTKISFNGDTFTAPFTQTVIVGSASSVVATTPQVVNGVIYNFVGWSDGGASTHNIVASAAGGTYAATFAAAATVPSPWVGADVGAVGLAGSSTYDSASGKFTVKGAGADTWGTADSFRYVYQPVTGDTQIVARVVSLQQTSPNAKAGVQFRQSLAADAANVQVDIEGDLDWSEFHARGTAGGPTDSNSVVGPTPGYWLKLTRVGNAFTGYASADKVTWQQVGTATVAMSASVYVGLAVCAHNTSQLNTAVFDDVSVTAIAAANTAPVIATAAAATVAADGTSANLTVAATDDGGEAALKYTWSGVSGPSAVAFTPNGTNAAKAAVAALSTSGTYVLRATVADAAGKTATSDVTVTVNVAAPGGDVTDQLIYQYKFDEGAGTTATSSYGGLGGSLQGGTTWTAGKGGSAVDLDGVDDYVRADASLAQPLGESATIAAWIKTTQVGTADAWATPGIVGVEQHWGQDDIFYGILDPAGRIGVQAGDGAAAFSTTPVNDGQWHHVAFTRDGASGQLKTYVDGVLQATAAGEPGVKSTPFQSIGRIENTDGPATYLKGALDDVRIYGKPLSAAEVLAVKNVLAPAATNAAPTVATAAKATPTAPLVGVPVALSALGADDGGEANLTDTWSVVSSPTGAAAPTFGANGTNAAKASTVTFAAAGAYTLRCTISDGTSSATSNVSVTATIFSSAKINFQPAAAAAVSGYLVDSGSTFGPRDATQAYGWNVAHTSNVFDRAKNANQLLDTVVLLKAGAKWELAVPSGTYSVKVSVGDPSAAATNTIRVEGTGAFAATATSANAYQTKMVSVKVTDGRLTLDNGSAGDSLTRLNYVEVTRTGNA
jgi:glucose/arabinose dehydrogenase